MSSAEVEGKPPDGPESPGVIAHLVPSTRVRADGSYVARYAGLDHLEGTGKSEGEAKRELVEALARWIGEDGGERMRDFVAGGGSDDITVTELPKAEAKRILEQLTRHWFDENPAIATTVEPSAPRGDEVSAHLDNHLADRDPTPGGGL